MIIVEVDGNYMKPVEVENLDIYLGELYSVLIRDDQDLSKNNWGAINVRGWHPKTPKGLAVLNYHPNLSTKLPTTPPPLSPI